MREHVMMLYDGIRKNNFLIIGRVGIDFFPDPPGTKTEDATLMSVGMGGSSANIAVSQLLCPKQTPINSKMSRYFFITSIVPSCLSV